MGQRLQLHSILEDILGSTNVYFQPPENYKLKYPCIVYNLKNIKTYFGDNNPYRKTKLYEVTAIDRNPDSELPDKLSDLKMCQMANSFSVDYLNHWVFDLYF